MGYLCGLSAFPINAICMKHLDFSSFIIGEDEHYIAVNKPPYVSSLEDRFDNFNMLSMARNYVPDAQLCHRLDKETSGLLMIAKHPEAYRHLSIQLERRQVFKLYHAIVDGIHDFKEDVVEMPLHTTTSGYVKINPLEGKPATTVFKTIEAFRHHTLIGCFPLTGRMHQIRVHSTFLGAPIAGDTQYGGKALMLSQYKRKFNLKKDEEEQPIIKRVALHARSFSFRSLNEEEVAWEAPYPKDFEVAVKQLRKFS
jgi:23S rRNA pseudouridine955/2504/2580 synthase